MIAAALSFLLLAASFRAEIAPSSDHPGIDIDDRGRPEERAVLESGLRRLRASPTARARESYRRGTGLRFVVSFAPLSGPEDKGVKGRCIRTESDDIRVVLKDELMGPATGLHQVLAHELYGHGISRATMPSIIAADFGRLEIDEINATLVGAVVARELGEDEIEDEALDAFLSGGAAAYHATVLFTDSPGFLKWTADEAKNPASALTIRLSELARRRRTLADREGGDRAWRWAFEHFENAHGVPRAKFAYARSTIDAWRREVSAPRRALLDEAQWHLKGNLRELQTPEGRAFVTRLIALTRDPHAAAMTRDSEALAKRLRFLRAAAPPGPASAPDAPPPGEMSWEKVQELYNRDHAEHPDHWKDEPRSTPPEDWIVP